MPPSKRTSASRKAPSSRPAHKAPASPSVTAPPPVESPPIAAAPPALEAPPPGPAAAVLEPPVAPADRGVAGWEPPEDDLPDMGDPEPATEAASAIPAEVSPAAAATPPTDATPAEVSPAAAAPPLPDAVSAEVPPASAGPAPPTVRASPDLPAAARRLCQLYQLGPAERRLLALLLEAETAPTLGAAQQQLGLGEADLAALVPPEGALRGHALVEVDGDAALGFLRHTDRLEAARGLRQLWHGDVDDATLFGQLPGVEHLAAPPPDTGWAEELVGPKIPPAVTEVVREHLVAASPRLLWLSGCGAEGRQQLARALRTRLGRPVVTLDCAALSGWGPAAISAALRRLRRDCDLRGAVLVAAEVQLVGGAWRALCAPRPAGQTAPVVLCSAGALLPLGAPPLGGRGESHLVAHTAELRLPETAPPAPAAPPAAEAAAEPVSASKEDARRQAAIDAALAMGKPVPPGLQSPPAGGPAAAPRPAAGGRAAATTLRPLPPPQAPPEPAPLAAPGSAPPPAPMTTGSTMAGHWRAPPAAPADSASAPATQAAAIAAAPDAGEAPSPEAAAAEATEQGPADAAPTEPPSDLPDQPPVPLASDAPIEEIVRVVRTTPSVRQCVELLRALSGQRFPPVILAFRLHLTSPHPEVRAAAEAGMASLFGEGWNKGLARPVPPPVQPARSDDGGRGPHGAF